ncbi:MAG: hypothetical protein H0T41_02945 [Rhodobacteraceae bacterium]|nr:hypothetical protein [Paracoccaceae bacterium]
MSRRGPSLNAVSALAGAVLLAGCSLPFGSIPASERNADSPEVVRDEERGLLTGLFTRAPRDLPDAVPVPMREAALERGYGGVILRATGVAPTQGFYDAALVAENDGVPDAAGVLTVALVAVPPETPVDVGPERTRLLLTAAYLSERELRDIRALRVVSAASSVTLPVPARPAAPPSPAPDLTVENIERGTF